MINPLVSIVIIFLNEERYLEEAIESIFAQSYDSWELLLVDDGSSDRSTDIALRCAERFPNRVQYVEHEQHANRGMSASRNLGLRHARGDYLALLDADDVWLSRKLEEQVPLLNAHPKVGMAYAATLFWHSWQRGPGTVEADFLWQPGIDAPTVFTPPDLLTLFLQRKVNMPCIGSTLMRRAAIQGIGGWEDEFRGLYEDQVFFAKLCLAAPVLATNDCWDLYRQHERSSCAIGTKTGQLPVARASFHRWLARLLLQRGLQATDTWRALEEEMARAP